MASSCIAPGALEGISSQIYDLDQDDQIYIREDGTPVFKLYEHFAPIYCNASERAVTSVNQGVLNLGKLEVFRTPPTFV